MVLTCPTRVNVISDDCDKLLDTRKASNGKSVRTTADPLINVRGDVLMGLCTFDHSGVTTFVCGQPCKNAAPAHVLGEYIAIDPNLPKSLELISLLGVANDTDADVEPDSKVIVPIVVISGKIDI